MDNKTQEKEAPKTRFTIGGKEIDIRAAFPFTLGDLRKLGKMKLLDREGNVNMTDADAVAKVLLYVIHKIDKEITEDQIDATSLQDLRKMVLGFSFLMKEGLEVPPGDHPTSTRSSSSDENLDGDQPTSTI